MNFKSYIQQGKLKKIKAKLDQIVRLIERAQKDLITAEKNLEFDEEWAYTIAYHSMLRSARALLLSKGLRPSGTSQHKTVVEISGLILGKEFAEIIDKFDRMRRIRSDFIYEYMDLSFEEAKNAIKSAQQLVSKIEAKIKNSGS